MNNSSARIFLSISFYIELLLLLIFHFYKTEFNRILCLAGITLALICIITCLYPGNEKENPKSGSTKSVAFRPPNIFLLIFFLVIFLIWSTFLLSNYCKPCHESKNISTTAAINTYFEKIRNNEAELRAFFSQMPKGGDLHNHFTGSVYAESYIEDAIRGDYWVNKTTLLLSKDLNQQDKKTDYARIAELSKEKDFPAFRQRLLKQWSVKDFTNENASPADHFFSAFKKFPKSDSWNDFHNAILELKFRAKSENVNYLEIMIGGATVNAEKFKSFDSAIQFCIAKQFNDSLNKIFSLIASTAISENKISINNFIDSLDYTSNNFQDKDFLLRYIISVKRESEPAEIFVQLLAAFEASLRDPLIDGVNIVAPEHGKLSMRDYHLHMLMFQFLHEKYPTVKYSLHAGELVMGMVKPEDLTFHIDEAVRIAGAQRIGHGVDIFYERNCYDLLHTMKDSNVAVEINLSSNEFILNVKNDQHPVMLYKRFNVPIVISTDDAGILRTNLTEQFVLLAKRYPEISYADIKKFIENSIDYSFIKEPEIKKHLLNSIESKLNTFEKNILLNAITN